MGNYKAIVKKHFEPNLPNTKVFVSKTKRVTASLDLIQSDLLDLKECQFTTDPNEYQLLINFRLKVSLNTVWLSMQHPSPLTAPIMWCE